MKRNDYNNITSIIKEGIIKLNEPMSSHTSFGIGGNTCYILPNNKSELAQLLSYCNNNKISTFFAGSGSNLLVSDDGFKGVVISLKKTFKALKISKEGIINAESGVMLGNLVKNAMKANIIGLESLIGVPGTLGGALIMNAGAYGSEISNYFLSADMMHMDGKIETLTNKTIKFSYRTSTFPKDQILINAKFKCKLGNQDEITKNKQRASLERKTKQPLKFRSAGSIFKNPKNGVAAGYLIDKAGLKGLKSGNAQISEKHANFIINRGDAKSEDVLKLIKIAKKEVLNKYSIHLKLEVKLLGFNRNIMNDVLYD